MATSVTAAKCRRALSREEQAREAALLLFCDPVPERCELLSELSSREWERLKHWLDTSGLALYFIDRIMQLGLPQLLPATVLYRLQQNCVENAERTMELASESAAIQREFQQLHLSYALLKGLSLYPDSVPDPTLRSQLDLDFLVSASSAAQARNILESRGYRLHAMSGRSLEFKSLGHKPPSLKQLYRPGHTLCVELHIEPDEQVLSQRLLHRVQRRNLRGFETPVLPPVELLLGQGLHLYKHVCSEFMRTAHLLEFRRHILARHDDHLFWKDLELRTASDASARMRLGLVIHLISRTMGDFAPAALTAWTVDKLPIAACHWVDVYGRQSVLAGFPGTKLYLLLQASLTEAGVTPKRSAIRSLLPRRLPPAIVPTGESETIVTWARRNLRQLRYMLFRLRFHVVEGARYLLESMHWRRGNELVL